MPFSERQQQIIEESINIIAKEGLEALTTKRISRRIGISEAALYRHFESKAHILLGILNYFEKRASDLLEKVCKQEISALEKLRSLLQNRCYDFIKNPAMITIILSEELFPQDSRLSKKVYEIMQMNRNFIERIIEEGQQCGQIRNDFPKEALFFLIIGPFRFMVARWRLSGFKNDLKKEFDNFWVVLEKILRKD